MIATEPAIQYRPHQDFAHQECQRLWRTNMPAWCVVSPCGAGKSLMMRRLALPAANAGKTVFIYTHRIMLTKQTVDAFRETGVRFGVIAASQPKLADPGAKIQICSLDTVHSRLGNYKYDIPKADLVIVDEAHQQIAEMAMTVFGKHLNEGARLIGFTATPVSLPSFYKELVIAGTYQDMLDCNAHLPTVCYGPDRPDLSKLKPMKGGDFSSEADRKINRVPTIIANVYSYWKKLNPWALPAIGFAPGVAESKWFVDEFAKRGVACAHIDAERVVLARCGRDGHVTTHEYETTDETRQEVIEGSKDGRYRIVFNRFLLREAIDMPWLFQAIVATSMGGLSTYLQAVGRVMRHWPELDHVCIQDHGGNLDRHGTPDVDRDWKLGCTNNQMYQDEKKRRERTPGDQAEPICCPQCSAYRTHGSTCHNCGYIHKKSVRMVRQIDGTLVKKVGRVVKHKPAKTFDQILNSCLYGAYAANKTVGQAWAMARIRAKEQGVAIVKPDWFPDRDHPDWQLRVRERFPNKKPKGLQ